MQNKEEAESHLRIEISRCSSSMRPKHLFSECLQSKTSSFQLCSAMSCFQKYVSFSLLSQPPGTLVGFLQKKKVQKLFLAVPMSCLFSSRTLSDILAISLLPAPAHRWVGCTLCWSMHSLLSESLSEPLCRGARAQLSTPESVLNIIHSFWRHKVVDTVSLPELQLLPELLHQTSNIPCIIWLDAHGSIQMSLLSEPPC